MSQPKKTAVVTGAGSGIGQAIAIALAENYHVAVLDLSENGANQTTSQIQKEGNTAEAHTCDVTSLESVQKTINTLNSVDALINNAGIASIGNAENTTPDELDKIYAVNVKGVHHCLLAALPRMVEKDGGSIVNMCSIAAKVGIADRFAYSMSKGAAYAMTLSVAKDYIDKGIRCNCICPARVHTPFVDGYLEKNYSEEERPKMFKTLSDYQPIGRMGTPTEIANLTAFLCSEKAAFITASAYDIDGGVTLLR